MERTGMRMGPRARDLLVIFALFLACISLSSAGSSSSSSSSSSSTSEEENLVNVEDYQKFAEEELDPDAALFIFGVAGDGETYRISTDAFQRHLLRPKRLTDVSQFDPSVTILGQQLSMPIGISPTGPHRWMHPDGSLATIRAADNKGALYVMSDFIDSPYADIIAEAPSANWWFGVHIFIDRSITTAMIQQAEQLGSAAIVVTVDTQVGRISYPLKRRLGDLPSFLLVPDEFRNINYPGFLTITDSSATWADLTWLVQQTSLPVILKGVQTASDVTNAAQCGVKAVWVSNHGGRSLDGMASTIDILPEIAAANQALPSPMEVYLDGGVRTGADVFRAIALGADMVFVGRPVLWGLAHSGQDGVEDILDILKDEFVNVAKLTGAENMAAITADMVSSPEHLATP